MKKEQFMTLAQIEAFMETRGNMYDNPHGVCIMLTGGFSANKMVWDKGPVRFTLYAEVAEADPELGRKLNFRSGKDIEAMDEAALWECYKNGHGYIWAHLNDERDSALDFRVRSGSTFIDAFNLDYRDRVVEVWGNVEPFRDYVRQNIQRIYIAEEAEERI